MEDLKQIISQNIVALRRESGMTQIELAEKLNYSDKAVSKWERGESIPDITVLKAIADLFGVTVDYLIKEEHTDSDRRGDQPDEATLARRAHKHAMITSMSVILVWVIATVLFVILDVALNNTYAHFLTFAYAVPTSCIVWLVFNSMWHNRRLNYAIISLMMWTLLTSIHLSVIVGGINLWQIYLLGIPGQIIILLWSKIGKKG
ncbi:MAG: helix-turn-helix transcriptional regulator [Clostridia bacterium]|nr:helix-turn-helix transcriptional regulator [Clostridia bacterium]